jgi:hypothetical protein
MEKKLQFNNNLDTQENFKVQHLLIAPHKLSLYVILPTEFQFLILSLAF